MSDIFISYAREDRRHAEAMAQALESKAWSVWWDRSIPTGLPFDEVIEKEIGAASCVVVLWSSNSVSSRWVRIEAHEGAERDVLIPVLMEQVDIPLAFKRLQATTLTDWDGKETAPGFARLLGDIESLAGPPRTPVERTVLFADICDSSRLTEVIGDSEARTHFKRLFDALGDITRSKGGQVIKTIGDKILSAFPDQNEGLLAAAEMQRHADALPAIQGIRKRVRVGLHSGPVLSERGDIFGSVVNVAARVVSLAAPDQALATGVTVEGAGPSEVAHRSLGEHHLGAREGRLQLCELLWKGESSGSTRVIRTLDWMAPPTLTCRVDGAEIVLKQDAHESLLMGRDPRCPLMVSSDRASREHGRILSRRGLFYLEDTSTNGTYVVAEGADQILVHRNELALHGRGKIRLGEPIPDDGECDIEYETGFGPPPSAE